MSQSTGKKIPKKNIHPCPFLSVITPSETSRTKYRTAPKPIPHHIVPPWIGVAIESLRPTISSPAQAAHHPIGRKQAPTLAF
jgi:hypothetical protein